MSEFFIFIRHVSLKQQLQKINIRATSMYRKIGKKLKKKKIFFFQFFFNFFFIFFFNLSTFNMTAYIFRIKQLHQMPSFAQTSKQIGFFQLFYTWTQLRSLVTIQIFGFIENNKLFKWFSSSSNFYQFETNILYIRPVHVKKKL